MSDHIFGLVGAGGFGREVMPMIDGSILADSTERVFIREGDVPEDEVVNGYRSMSLDAFLDLPQAKSFNIAFADSINRERVAARCIEAGCKPVSIQAASAIMLGPIEQGEGLIMAPFALVTSNTVLGRFVHLNYYSTVGHDCLIEDFVTLSPGVKCSGNVIIGKHAFVGAGAVIREGSAERKRQIGAGAVVGMGAIVTRDVLPGQVVFGNPARVFRESRSLPSMGV